MGRKKTIELRPVRCKMYLGHKVGIMTGGMLVGYLTVVSSELLSDEDLLCLQDEDREHFR